MLHRKNYFLDLLIIAGFFLGNLAVQFHSIGKLVYVFTDEGVYLYSAKLITQGLIPYKDFFLAQPPLLIYLGAILLKLSNFNLNLFHYIYTCWVFISIIPIYLIVYHITKSRIAAILSMLLFSTFVELVAWDARFFALRQVSLPFLALSLYFILVNPKQKIAGSLLGLFALGLFSNLLMSLALILSIFFNNFFYLKVKIKDIFKENFSFLLVFCLINFFGYLTILFIANSFNNIISYQLSRPFIPPLTRIFWIISYSLKDNWPILLTGFLGSLLTYKKVRIISNLNILYLLCLIFIGSSFYPHYLTSLAITLAISAGIFISFFGNSKMKIIILTIVILLGIYISSYKKLKYNLIESTTPIFFKVTDILNITPQPLFTFEPIYGLYAKKELTFHYHVADMRYFRVMGKNLDDGQYRDILSKSNTILIEPFIQSLLPSSILEEINQRFIVIYNDGKNYIYVRKE